MSEEVVVGNLTKIDSAAVDDFLLLWTKTGALVIIPVSKFRQDFSGTLAPSNNVLTVGGIKAMPTKDVTIFNNGGQGIKVTDDNKIVLDFVPTVGASTLLTKAVADDTYSGTSFNVSQTAHGFANGNPARWNAATPKWEKPGAPGAFPAVDDWSGIVKFIDLNTFTLVASGRVKFTTNVFPATPGIYYWSQATNAWVTAKPTAFGAFEGKIQVISAQEAVILPFKRRSASMFRPVQTQPTGAGRINALYKSVTGASQTILMGCTNPAGSPGIFKSVTAGSVEAGDVWGASLKTVPTGFTGIERITAGPGASTTQQAILLSLSGPTPAGTARTWAYTLDTSGTGTLGPYPTSTAWGSTGSGVKGIAFISGIGWAFLWGASVSPAQIYFRYTLGTDLNWTANSTIQQKNVNNIVFSTNLYIAAGNDIYMVLSGNLANGTIRGQTANLSSKVIAPVEVLSLAAISSVSLLAGTSDGKIYKTPDATALSASVSSAVWTQAPISGGSPTAINAFVKAAGTTWYVAASDGVYRSDNDGDSWYKVFGSIEATALVVNDSGKVIVGTGDGRMFISIT